MSVLAPVHNRWPAAALVAVIVVVSGLAMATASSITDPTAAHAAPPAVPADANAGTFVPLVPSRIYDSRSMGSRLEPEQVLSLRVPLPPPPSNLEGAGFGVSAVALNLTATEPDADGYLTVYPCGEPTPLASNVNYRAGTSVANGVAVGLGADASVCIVSLVPTHVVVDLGGYWLAVGSPKPASRYTPLSPRRLVDSRTLGGPLGTRAVGTLSVQTVSDERIRAVSLNVTAVDPSASGYVTIYPCTSSPPNVSNVNYEAGQTVANSALVAVSGDEKVCFFTSAATHLVIDVTGFFGATGATTGGRSFAVTPTRAVDTRDGPMPAAGSTVGLDLGGELVPREATGVVTTVIAVAPEGAGYLTAYGCGGPAPNASTVNYVAGAIVPNLAFTNLGVGGRMCVTTFAAAHIVVDVSGFIVP